MQSSKVRLAAVAGIMVSVSTAVSASLGSDTPVAAFLEVVLVGLVCTFLAIRLSARNWS